MCGLFQALEQHLMPHLRTYWNQLKQVLDDNSQSNALLKQEAYQVFGSLLVNYSFILGVIPAKSAHSNFIPSLYSRPLDAF